jgi:hypothetical protein
MYTAQSTLIIFWHAMMSDQLLAEGKSERRLGFLKPCFWFILMFLSGKLMSWWLILVELIYRKRWKVY